MKIWNLVNSYHVVFNRVVEAINQRVVRSNKPDVAKIPPTMPHSRTRNCQYDLCSSRTEIFSDDRSYFTKIPGMPWLPAAWSIVRF